MKKIIFSVILLSSIQFTYSQSYAEPTPCPDNTCLWGCPLPIKQVISESKFVFEGRILTDSVFKIEPSSTATYHYVLVLKEFKGTYTSDTMYIITLDGTFTHEEAMKHWPVDYSTKYAYIGDEAVFCVSDVMIHYNPNILMLGALGEGCGFVKVCDKKDVVKEVYEPIEAATGQKYVDVHPNTCATQKKQKK